MTSIGENDWLGTTPLFYHERTGEVSQSINDVIDLRALEFDLDGLRDYLDFGYCVFGHTPVRHVRFLPPCTRLVRTDTGGLCEERLQDTVEQWSGRQTTEDDVIDQLRAAIHAWENSVEGPIILPTSGGLDSRILGLLMRNKTRLRSFTYGISNRPNESSEVVIAKQFARKLGVRWEQIQPGNFHQYLNSWDDLFGCSTHAHGMYHFSFFDQIRACTQAGLPLLSGIVGDAWAGSIGWIPACSADELPMLGYSHGVSADQGVFRHPGRSRWRDEYWEQEHDKLVDRRFQVVEVIRLKMMLLRYLLEVPRSLGFRPWSPFTDPTIALAMVCLPSERRAGRRWQHEFFAKAGVDFPARGSRQNSMDLNAVLDFPPPPLDIALLRELFDETALDRVNHTLNRPDLFTRVRATIQTYPLGRRLVQRLSRGNPLMEAYATYCTLKPLERLLQRRNGA